MQGEPFLWCFSEYTVLLRIITLSFNDYQVLPQNTENSNKLSVKLRSEEYSNFNWVGNSLFGFSCELPDEREKIALVPLFKKATKRFALCFGHKRGKAGCKEPILSFLFFKRANQS